MTIWCRWCKVGYASVGELPPICPSCDAPAEWVTDPWPFKLTVNDRQFLKSIRVGAT